MRGPILIVLAILCALAAVEATAYWWMNPAPAGLGEPVLVYRPGDRGQGTGSLNSKINNQQSSIFNPQSSSSSPSTLNSQPSTSSSSLSTINYQPSTSSPSTSSTTLLPEVVAAALPSLRCTTGTAARIDREDGATIHLAFFEWDLADSTNVLEAFKHLPDECMGSIGMTLIEKRPPRTYVVGRRGAGDGEWGLEIRDEGLGIRDQDQANAQTSSSSSRSTINSQPSPSSTSPSSPSTTSSQLSTSPASTSSPNLQSPISHHDLVFDHTVFRDPAGVIVHAFKGTWVSGAGNLLGDGLRGGVEQWNQLRWKSAFKRFRPAHARVAQGAVRGIPNPDFAWEAFESAMLKDLAFTR